MSTKHLNKIKSNFPGFFRIGESYTSLVLGIIVVIVVTILIIAFVRQRNGDEVTDESATTKSGDLYTVGEGETLWDISEKEFGSGYNWVDIASENNLGDPNAIEAGTELKIPDVEPKTPTTEEAMSMEKAEESEVEDAMKKEEPKEEAVMEKKEETAEIKGDSYVVKEGDYLWKIAVEAYGDGFKWVEIAKVNNISNPDLIYPETKLKLPR